MIKISRLSVMPIDKAMRKKKIVMTNPVKIRKQMNNNENFEALLNSKHIKQYKRVNHHGPHRWYHQVCREAAEVYRCQLIC